VDAREIVRTGYERLGPRYWEWSRDNDPKYRERYLDLLLDELTPHSLVVELGSGSGVPTAHVVTHAGHRLICVDFALAQLAEVGKNAPRALRIAADMSEMQFANGSLDAVVSFYSIIHVPREDHRRVLASIYAWLRPGGIFVASLGANDDDADNTEDWIDGITMFWSSFDADTNTDMIRGTGFDIVRREVLENFEDGRTVKFLWVLARKPRDAGPG
jgi:SAM-dependent methyltransferase